MLQHTTSEVTIIQLQINLNSKIQIKLFRDLKPALNENVGSENFIYIISILLSFYVNQFR